MEQKEVKIIGLKVNTQMGILQSFELKLDPKNHLLVVKGEVGSGKTTLHKSLSLGTQGSEALKADKLLYGKIDQEVQLLDEGVNIFVGCKSNKKGELDYIIYSKDENGKIEKNPVVGGVKLTPATYLKEMQTKLTWRIDELTSENLTVQKKMLLDLYKSALAQQGVVFDKNDQAYDESILGRIDRAVNDRSEKDYARKQVGGFRNQLEPIGIDVDESDSYPTRIDVSALELKKTELTFSINNAGSVKQQNLDGLKNKADAVVLKIKEANVKIKQANDEILKQFEDRKHQCSQNKFTYDGVLTDLETLVDQECLTKENGLAFLKLMEENFNNPAAMAEPANAMVEFDMEGRVVGKLEQWKGGEEVGVLLKEYEGHKSEWLKIFNEPLEDTAGFEGELETVVNNLSLAKENNSKCEMVDRFLSWRSADEDVRELRNEYAKMLSSINTGVDGLKICVDRDGEDNKLDIYLTYNGEYDKKYFNNLKLEDRKLSSYSGTQKPMICLLLQNYLLSKKPKAMRYLWIDNIPIDNKTKALLDRMGKELGLTVIVNITGDFDKAGLESGEILLEGGEVFFN